MIYTVGYPPRLVPVSLVLPGLNISSSSVFANVSTSAPTPAPAGAAKAPAVPAVVVSASDVGVKPPAPGAALEGRVTVVKRQAPAPVASFQSKVLDLLFCLSKPSLIRA